MFHQQPSLLNSTQPIRTQEAYIQPGKYIDIDQKIYDPQPPLVNNFVGGINPQFGGIAISREELIPTIQPEQLRVNFGTYLYNQQTNRF